MAEINTENNIKNTQTMDEHKTYMFCTTQSLTLLHRLPNSRVKQKEK